MAITKATASSIAPAAKGDLVVGSATNDAAVLGVGSNDQVLTADSSTATGLKWATASSGGMTLLSTTTLSGTSTDVTSISQDYNELVIWVYGVTNNTANGVHFAKPLNNTTILDVYGIRPEDSGATYLPDTQAWRAGGSDRVSSDVSNYSLKSRTDANNFWQIRLPNYNSTTSRKGYVVSGGFYSAAGQYTGWQNLGFVNSNSAINGFRFENSGGTFSAGTIKVWGVK